LISVAGVGYAPSYHGKTLSGQIVNPEFVPLRSLHPQPLLAYRHQQQNSKGWSYSFAYPSPIDVSAADVSPSKQGGGATTTTTRPAPSTQCGKGPTALPKQSLMSEKVSGSGTTKVKANAWPFLVS
jgi:hypothetical protein